MITKDELVKLYEDKGFIITHFHGFYSIRAPDWIENSKINDEIHYRALGNKCTTKCTIDNLLLLAVKIGIVKIIN